MLFAEHGVKGASLRQIGVASGSANTNAVAHHFGERDALIAWERFSFGEDYPTTARILGIGDALFRARLAICTNMIVASLDLLEGGTRRRTATRRRASPTSSR